MAGQQDLREGGHGGEWRFGGGRRRDVGAGGFETGGGDVVDGKGGGLRLRRDGAAAEHKQWSGNAEGADG